MAKFVSRKKRRMTIIIAVALAVVTVCGLLAAFLIAPAIQASDTSIKFIRVKNFPKTTYTVGELASYDGLQVEAVLSNGNKQDINLTECTIEGFSTENVTDSQTITIKYREYSCIYTISVTEGPKENITLTEVRLITLPEKLTFSLDDDFDITGATLLCIYSDETTKDVELLYQHIKEYEPTEVGEYVITIIYEDEYGRATTTYTVTITE